MSNKQTVMIGMTIGSIIGSFIPTLFGADLLSFWSIITTAIGGFIGIYVGWKIGGN